MRFNAFASFSLTEGEVEFDENGVPVSADEGLAWSQQIPCSARAVTDNRLARYEDGTFHQQSFSVMIEAHAMEERFYASKNLTLTFEGNKKVVLPIASITTTAQMGVVQITV